jgi:hypothetical protein
MLFRMGAKLLLIASLFGCAESDPHQVDKPVEDFQPTKILAHSRLNLWLGTEERVVYLHLELPERIAKSTEVAVSGVLNDGPDVHKHKMPQGGAPQPPWPKERDHLYRQEELRSGLAVCKPTGKVYDHHGVYEAVELAITLKELTFEDRVLRIDRPIVVFWNMPPPP